MKHLLKGLTFFVGFNVMMTLGMCWYNFLLGNGFNLRNLSTDIIGVIVVMGFFTGAVGCGIIYGVGVTNDN